MTTPNDPAMREASLQDLHERTEELVRRSQRLKQQTENNGLRLARQTKKNESKA